ncbi:MAG: hypothetical protein Q8P11_02500 [bacterium]|nr:hypothetical protein [bacterium]
MFCIASFIVFAILALFSAQYRPLAKKAWYCVFRKITFRPCDINFDQEVKGKLLGSLMKRSPVCARFVYKRGNILAWIFVILSVWSLIYVVNAGLNLYVYDTCNPRDVQSCSLGGEACGIDQSGVRFVDAIRTGKIGQWISDPFVLFGQTVVRIPDRIKTWHAQEYVPDNATYFRTFDAEKPTAVEVIDPGCHYCGQLLENIKEAGFEDRYNLTYIAYPIPSTQYDNGYQFAHSYVVTSYLEALRMKQNTHNGMSDDWFFLETTLLGKDIDGVSWQIKFNTLLDDTQVEMTILDMLSEMGYDELAQDEIKALAHSDTVKDTIAHNRDFVEQKIRTIKIPTIMFGGRRYDRVVDPETLKK